MPKLSLRAPTSYIFGLIVLFLARADGQTPVFTSGLTLVHVDAQVRNGEGSLVPGLSKLDFRIFDGKVEQAVVAFAKEDQPLDLILLIDVSGSINLAAEHFAVTGSRALRELRTGDRVAVMTFNTKTQVVAPFTEKLDLVEQTLRQLETAKFRGSTHCYDGIYDAATFLLGIYNEDRRRAVLIVTDNFCHNFPSHGKHSVMSAVENLWEADATLSGIVTSMRAPFGRHRPFRMSGGIQRPVAMTGGEMLAASDMVSVFPEILNRVRNRYSLYYRLPEGEPGLLRSIRVELSDSAKRRFPSARVLAREGYRVGKRDENALIVRP